MLLLLIIPVLSTLAGGLLAVRLRRWLPLLVALGAGLLLGAAFLDLLPEALILNASSGRSGTSVLGIVLLSFLVFFALQGSLEAVAERWQISGSAMGQVGGALLIFHSLRDGMAIGLSYAASHTAGYAVAAGIAAHDLGDGMNTILLTTRGKQARPADYLFLAGDAAAPFVGGWLTLYWHFSPRSSVVLLAVAAGFFLQMATGEFLPQLRQGAGGRSLAAVAVLLGAGLIYAANLLAGAAL